MPVPSPMCCGNQRPTSAGMAGWVIATPAPITMVAPNSVMASDAAPRSAEPPAVSTNPATIAATAPIRPTSLEPAKAAAANRMIGRPVRIPISVPDRPSSSRNIGITGGTARIGNRSALPTSHKSPRAIGRDGDFTTGISRRAFEPLERFGDLHLSRLGLLALFPLAFDYLFGRPLEEIGIAEFLVDTGDVGVALRHLLGEPRALHGEIDDALERETRQRVASNN